MGEAAGDISRYTNFLSSFTSIVAVVVIFHTETALWHSQVAQQDQ